MPFLKGGVHSITKSTKESKIQKIYCVENFGGEASSVFFVSFVLFVDDMQYCLFTKSLCAIAAANRQTLDLTYNFA
jgi:hypothetical protein